MSVSRTRRIRKPALRRRFKPGPDDEDFLDKERMVGWGCGSQIFQSKGIA